VVLPCDGRRRFVVVTVSPWPFGFLEVVGVLLPVLKLLVLLKDMKKGRLDYGVGCRVAGEAGIEL
jgi:hypothetical protein